MSENKVALVTGAAKRIGAAIATALHQQGMNVVIHYHHSKQEAEALCLKLNRLRQHSAISLGLDIRKTSACQTLIQHSTEAWQRLDLLVNNASSFYPTPIMKTQEKEWEDLLGSNLKGPFFLSQAAAPFLKLSQGNIINITDIHADRPLKNYTIYSIAKAGLVMLTKSLARELGPRVRVNAVAPGAILWPNEENALNEKIQQYVVARTCLKRQGFPQDIAAAVLFLNGQNYITGQIITVDGGRSIKD